MSNGANLLLNEMMQNFDFLKWLASFYFCENNWNNPHVAPNFSYGIVMAMPKYGIKDYTFSVFNYVYKYECNLRKYKGV